MEKIKRAIHFDFHTLPGIGDIASEWNAERFAKTLKKAKVEFINATAQCNVGYSYYPTKSGVVYPGLKIDLFGELVKACHKEGIKVVGYVSTGLNHEACIQHPDWCGMLKDGRTVYTELSEYYYRVPCYNTAYGKHMLKIYEEVLNCGADGLFLDNVVMRRCYCPVCMQKMKDLGINTNNDKEVDKFAENSLLDFTQKVRDLIPSDKYMYVNGFGDNRIRTHREIECLPTGGWGYDIFPVNVSFSRNIYDQVLYMTGRFRNTWGDFGGYRNRESIENDIYDALLYGTQVSVGDHLHPRGKLDDELYDMIGDIYNKVEKYEKWTDDAKYIKEVGIVTNFDVAQVYYTTRESYDGATRILAELKYNFDIINVDMDFDPYKVIILPDQVQMTPELMAKLEKFLENKEKAVLSSGRSLLDENNNFVKGKYWDFIEFISVDETKTSYYKLNNSDRCISTYNDGILMKTAPENTIAKYIKPYFDYHWDGTYKYSYTPPDKETEYASVAEKGRWRHISFRLFNSYYNFCYKEHRELVADFLSKFINTPLIDASNLPHTSRASLTGTEDYKLLHIKVTYPEITGKTTSIEEHNVLPAGKKIKIYGVYTNVCILPDERKIDCANDGKYTEITLPEIIGYEMFKLEK